jgi:hypothetical protein
MTMKTNRRKFISTTLTGGLAAVTLPLSCNAAKPESGDLSEEIKSRYDRIDEILVSTEKNVYIPVLKPSSCCDMMAISCAGFVQKMVRRVSQSVTMTFQFFFQFFSESCNHFLSGRMPGNLI